MNFVEIQETETDIIHLIWRQHAETFPPEERRNREQFLDLWHQPEAAVSGIFQDKTLVGYIVSWVLESALFLEHFEIFPTFRNGGQGAKVLQQLCQNHTLVVLETEPPHLSEMAARRVSFYERNGFQVLEENYLQPAYDATKNAQPMWLMANNSIENPARLRAEIYHTVYNTTF